jgi:hypothetical protein
MTEPVIEESEAEEFTDGLSDEALDRGEWVLCCNSLSQPTCGSFQPARLTSEPER